MPLGGRPAGRTPAGRTPRGGRRRADAGGGGQAGEVRLVTGGRRAGATCCPRLFVGKARRRTRRRGHRRGGRVRRRARRPYARDVAGMTEGSSAWRRRSWRDAQPGTETAVRQSRCAAGCCSTVRRVRQDVHARAVAASWAPGSSRVVSRTSSTCSWGRAKRNIPRAVRDRPAERALRAVLDEVDAIGQKRSQLRHTPSAAPSTSCCWSWTTSRATTRACSARGDPPPVGRGQRAAPARPLRPDAAGPAA